MKLLDGLEVVSKRCRGPCAQEKPIEQFNRKKRAADGHQPYCIQCARTMTSKAMHKLRDCEARVAKKQRARFDEWLAEWLKAHPEEGDPPCSPSAPR